MNNPAAFFILFRLFPFNGLRIFINNLALYNKREEPCQYNLIYIISNPGRYELQQD